MIVKVGDETYDSHEVPVMIVVSEGEKQQIADMPEGIRHYCQYPDGYFEDDAAVLEWMDDYDD